MDALMIAFLTLFDAVMDRISRGQWSKARWNTPCWYRSKVEVE